MKILFNPIYPSTPHFETELELMKLHLDKGDEVIVLQCKGNLKTCFANPEHNDINCNTCITKIRNGIKLIKSPNLKIIDYPRINIDFSIIPTKFENINELKMFEVEGISIGLGALSSIMSRLNREHKLDTIKYAEQVSTEIKTAYYLAQIFEKSILPKYKPDIVYIFNGRISTTSPVVDVCEKYNVNFVLHERGGQIGRYWLVPNGRFHDVYRAYKEIDSVWGDHDRKEALEKGSIFFIDRKNRIEQGWYSYTAEQKSNLLPESFSTKRKNIVFFNSTIEEFAAVKGWEKPLYLFDDEIDALKTILEYFKNDESKFFYLRVHPNLKNTDNSQTQEIYKLDGIYSNFEIIPPESPIDSYSLVDNAELVITFGSTVGIEAAYWNKPSILLGMSFYNSTDAVYIPESKEELYKQINSDLKPKDKLGAIKYGFWELNRGHKFKYFEQESLTTGKFLGVRLTGKPYKNQIERMLQLLRSLPIRVYNKIKRILA